jgi:BlaR1 peptidase M56
MSTLGVVGAVGLPLAIWLAPELSAGGVIATASFELPPVFVTPSAASSSFPWLFAIWALGTFVVGARIVRAQLAARRLVRAATPVDGEIMRSAQIGSPMTVGILRPRILIPTHVEYLHAVLLHERGHIARRDLLVQLVAQIACAMYWWNPLVWVAAARLRIEREHACDDLVIAAGVLPSSYASDILAVAHSISYPGAVCMVDGTSTESRLRRILDARTPRTMRTRFRVTACVLACASLAVLACSSSRPVAPVPRVSFGAPFMNRGALQPPAMFRAPTTLPAIDLSLVAAEVQRRSAALEACYQRRLAAKPSLAGTVEIHWVIEESGRVPESCITKDTVGDDELTRCVNALVRDGVFPAPAGGAVDVSVPFVFAARS